MAEPGRRPRTQGIAGTWPLGGRAQAGGFAPVGFDAWSSFVAKLKAWIRAEAGAGRLLPWVPVAFGAGIALYFTADREPVFWVTVVPAALLCGVCWPMRRHRLLAVAVLAAAVAAGFATATFRTARIVHTALMRPLYSVALSGFVEARDIREKTDRFVLRATTMESPRGQLTLERVRLSVKKGTAPDVGSFVELKARLMPPLAALRPGSYDFARDLFFQGIGEKLEIRKPIAVARFQRS
ncbi:MAG TPA: ComEC/Rec2 family competence protein [Bradyrhizobium sp.]|jgi:competence protein ComEC|nr:ComEC/Rec2 family competence protein [Bradyrhizobium sp.]HWX61508.1 ComEC/Rec2 family competence protein [Bradyrhizobium sp.]